METRNRTAVAFAGAGALVILLASAPAFAAPGASAQEDRDDHHRNEMRHDNERVEHQGHVRSFTRERDGYRIYVDNDERSFWVPADRLNRPLTVGLAINLGGVFRGGLVNVDAVTWPEEHVNGDRDLRREDVRRENERVELRGVVDRIDYRSHTLWLRSEGRRTRVDMRDRDLRDVRRGDRISLGGKWIGGGNFTAYRIDHIH